ncbi:ABC1 family-domain-containing protein [Chytriomyces sp. MP71]|nr:ABC1 family-domain-containing protein [Chytriomyces sp. MP71]
MLPRFVRSRAPIYGLGAVAVGYGVDHYFYCDSVTRNLRTLAAGVVIAYEYKVNFVPGSFDRVHQRTADLILDTCAKNGGLYIKFAQQIASFSAILPPQWSSFKKLYDQAPSIPYDEVVTVIKAELGAHPNDLFERFEEVPVASASIAQVHKATLKGSGLEVAVKVQKPDVKVQVELDLFAFKVVIFLLERLFDLPMTWTVQTIETHLREELDFIRECNNAETAAKFVREVPSLNAAVHVPKVHWDLTSSRVMTAEWIDGVSFAEVEKVEKRWSQDKISSMMTVLVDLFSDQIFRSGFVHCDPHPGNILIRPNPANNAQPQIVLLDHGLYVQQSPQFTSDYTRLWTSLFAHDIKTVEEIVARWGISDVQLFAIGTLQKPWTQQKGIEGSTVKDVFSSTTQGRQELSDDPEVRKKQLYDMQLKMKERAKKYLSDTDKVPRELIFVGRNLNIIRSNNKSYGSPVNRINLMCNWARATQFDRDAPSTPPSLPARILAVARQPSILLPQIYTYTSLAAVSLLFHGTRLVNAARRWWNWLVGCTEGRLKGFEDALDEKVRKGIYEQTGGLLDEDAFEA